MATVKTSYQKAIEARDAARMNRAGMSNYEKQINQRAIAQQPGTPHIDQKTGLTKAAQAVKNTSTTGYAHIGFDMPPGGETDNAQKVQVTLPPENEIKTGGGSTTNDQVSTENAPSIPMTQTIEPSAPSSFGPGSKSGLTASVREQQAMVSPSDLGQMQPTAPTSTAIPASTVAQFSSAEDFFKGLGQYEQDLKKEISQYESSTGQAVYYESPEFQKLMKDHLNDKVQWGNIFKRFTLPRSAVPRYSAQEKADKVTMANTTVTAPTGEQYESLATPVRTPRDQIQDALDVSQSRGFDEQFAELLNMPVETPSAQLIKQALSIRLEDANDPTIDNYLNMMELRAVMSYKDGLEMIARSREEIDEVIKGTLTSPETSEGLLAYVYKQNLKFQQEAITESKDYQNQRYYALREDAQKKRADLEGYTKAKLYSMGAQDSAQGITLLSKVLSEADLQMTLAELDHDHAVSQLDLEGRQLMADYTNSVAELIMSNDSKAAAVLSTYNESLDKIDSNRIANEKEKKSAKLEALATYMKDTQDLQASLRQEKLDQMDAYYKQAEYLRDTAFKVSGLWGTIFVPDENGNLVDSGIPTFDARKYDDESTRDMLRIQQSFQQENRLMANQLISQYGSSAAPYVEKLLGMPEGALDGVETISEINARTKAYEAHMKYAHDATQDGYDEANGAILDNYLANGGGIKKGGIGIDPATLPDVREQLLALGTITQKFSKPGSGLGTDGNGGHGGTDIVFKDGEVHTLRGGTVVEVIPWDGTSPYGAVMRIQDETGLVWQYAHMGDRRYWKADNPFYYQPGDTVEAGDPIGVQGNTGRVYSQKSPSDPTYGVHADIRIVGKMDPVQPANQSNNQSNNIFHMIGNLWGGGSSTQKERTVKDMINDYELKTGELADEDVTTYINKYGEEGLKVLLDKAGVETDSVTLAD